MTTSSRRLEGRAASVTRSTSGIGLGIARALAAEGANVMLNGFGDLDAIEAVRERLASDCGVDVLYSGGDVAKRADIGRICPGWVLTPLVQKQIDDLAAREHVSLESATARLLGEKQPSLAFATADQIGALAVFLCSEAAAQIRGAALPVDGGWTAQ